MKKLAEFIVKYRYVFLGIFVVATICFALAIPHVNENYDMAKYLSSDTETKKALTVMEKEFGPTNTVFVVKKGITLSEANDYVALLEKVEGVELVTFDKEKGFIGDSQGKGNALFSLMLSGSEYSRQSSSVVKNIREIMGDCAMSGGAVSGEKLDKVLAKEIPIIMIIAVVIVAGVLLLTSHSFIEPVIFAIVIGTAIVINMGSNVIFSSISYITKAVAAILQLALAMDYSIMLLHSYTRYKEEEGMDPKSAVTEALRSSFVPIFSSALTTVAGLAALMFMSFTIGFDVGIVLSKGILISVLTVYFMMPSLILLFDKAIKRTAHKPIPFGGQKLGALAVKTKVIIPAIMLCVIIAAFFVQRGNTYTFSTFDSNKEVDEINSMFGVSSQIAVIFDGKFAEDEEVQSQFLQKVSEYTIEDNKILGSAKSYLNTTVSIDDFTAQFAALGIGERLKALLGTDELALPQLMKLKQYDSLGDIEFKAEYLSVLGFDEDKCAQLYAVMAEGGGEKNISSAVEFLSEYMSSDPDFKFSQRMIVSYLRNNMDSLNEKIYGALDKTYAMFNGENYSRIILEVSLEKEKQSTYDFIDFLKASATESFGENNFLAGECISTYDISTSFKSDLLRTNMITVLAILLIVGLSFASLSMPVILVLVIQGAIWIALAWFAIINSPIFFMSYIICSAIMMGATIDYGILLSSHYISFRKKMPPNEAIKSAVHDALPTIFTSGLILIIAGYIVGFMSSIMPIYSIGRLLGFGTIISVLMVLFLLPPLLLLLDKVILKTTYHKKAKSVAPDAQSPSEENNNPVNLSEEDEANSLEKNETKPPEDNTTTAQDVDKK